MKTIYNCELCGKTIDPATEGKYLYQKVQGYSKRRDQGGTNALRLREPLDEFAHRACVDLAASGINFGQQSLM